MTDREPDGQNIAVGAHLRLAGSKLTAHGTAGQASKQEPVHHWLFLFQIFDFRPPYVPLTTGFAHPRLERGAGRETGLQIVPQPKFEI